MIISKKRKSIPIIGILTSVAILVGFLSYIYQGTSDAANVSKFDPGNLISDSVMSNKSTMNIQQIQAFLDSKNNCNNTNTHMAAWYPHLQYTIRDGKFVCMAKDSFGGQSAAQIIWQVAQDYSINPQVLIVLLEKEQGLVSDTWPNNVQYRTATGYGCPDTSPCDSQYFGLNNQLRQAASLFRTVLNGGWSNYPVGHTYVQYNPNGACGGSVINIQNRATSALYRYTPYQPNQSALNAGYGTGDSCGAYGNRNFWMLFTDWFGSTQSGIQINMAEANQKITTTYNNYRSQLGAQVTGTIPEYDSNVRVWQNFQRGTIVWTQKYGAYVVLTGDVYNRWRALGGSTGELGVPKNNPITENDDGRTWQEFQKGTIIHSSSTGAWEIFPGPIGDKWRSTGGSLGTLGKPVSEVSINNSMRQQMFEKGAVTRGDLSSPAYAVTDSIYNKWQNNKSKLGAATMDALREASDNRLWQNFKNGLIIDSTMGTWAVYPGLINDRWRTLGGSTGELGVPQGSEFTESDGRLWQDFETGTIVKGQATGTWEVQGGFYTFWKQHGGSLGELGKPTGTKQIESNDTRWQDFENGRATWKPSTGWSIDWR